jgi:trehalose 6-phosphate synthase
MEQVSGPDPRINELGKLCDQLFQRCPLIVGSNRGPLEFRVTTDGLLQPRPGSGAVVTALSRLIQRYDFVWVANALGEGDRRALRDSLGEPIQSPLPMQRVSVRYVTTARRVYHKFYNIFCNPLLWFLQHYMWSPPYTPNVDGVAHDAWETGYRVVNQAFADAIVLESEKLVVPPLVILHDYHLYLVAGMVRERVSAACIYQFIHIPWPAVHFWRLLPRSIRLEIFKSLCATDLIGFQTGEDAQNFLSCCSQFLDQVNVDLSSGTIDWNGHRTKVRTYPTSIDVDEVRKIASSPRVNEYERVLAPMCDKHTIVRVDRAEPSKNIVRGFRSYQLFLERYPEFRGQVNFLAFLVPARTHIKQYERYRDEIDNLVNNINTTYGTSTWTPIRIFYENNYAQALAGMRLYDTLLVNSVADGMNLVAKEGPVVNAKNGVLILSEGTGAYSQLRDDALVVAATDLHGGAEAFHQAVTMNAQERADRNANLMEKVKKEDVLDWLIKQVRDLDEVARAD